MTQPGNVVCPGSGSRPHDNIGSSEDHHSHKFVGKGACS